MLALGALGALVAAPLRAQEADGFRARLERAQALAAADLQRGIAAVQALRPEVMGPGRLAERLALDEAECRLQTDADVAAALAVAEAGLAAAAGAPARPAGAARASWLRLRACRAGMWVEAGRPEPALAELERLLADTTDPGDAVPRAIALVERGVARSRAGDLGAGQRDLIDACRVLGEQAPGRDRDLCLLHLASHYRRSGDLDEALRLLQDLRRSAQRNGATFDDAIYAYATAQVLQEQRRWAEALAAFIESEQMNQRLGDRLGTAYAQVGAAGALLQLGRVGEAVGPTRAAIDALAPGEDPRQLETARITWAEIQLAQGRPADALATLESIDHSVRSRGMASHSALWLRAQAATLAALGRWREAHAALAELRALEARIDGEKLSRQTAALRMQFNRERDTAELDTLRQLNEQGQRLRQTQAVALLLSGLLLGLLMWVAWQKFRQARRLQTLASTDELTGLLNRRSLLAQAEEVVGEARRAASGVSLLMIDVDFFKRINDAHGHAGGDLVLRHVARELAAGLRGRDRLGRFGGEEFVVVMPDTAGAAAAQVAERMRAAMASVPAELPGGTRVPLTVSIGVAGVEPGQPVPDVQTLLARADAALYGAKNGGRNAVALAPAAAP